MCKLTVVAAAVTKVAVAFIIVIVTITVVFSIVQLYVVQLQPNSVSLLLMEV